MEAVRRAVKQEAVVVFAGRHETHYRTSRGIVVEKIVREPKSRAERLADRWRKKKR